jgi:hypothetical protein
MMNTFTKKFDYDMNRESIYIKHLYKAVAKIWITCGYFKWICNEHSWIVRSDDNSLI